ncbi:MAG TPA: hypothetical protein VGP26_31585 [Actinophytocola sp.]|nr:hypothetical protein [Actinophytocola sp.]
MVEGFLTGLGIISVGLIAFPYSLTIVRPASGQQSNFSGAKRISRWSRVASWLLAALTVGTIGGYVVIFVSAEGKFCDARLNPATSCFVMVWTGGMVLTMCALVASVVLRWRLRVGYSR